VYRARRLVQVGSSPQRLTDFLTEGAMTTVSLQNDGRFPVLRCVHLVTMTTNREKLHCGSSDCVMWRLVIDCLTVSNRRTRGCFQHVYIDISPKKTMFRL